MYKDINNLELYVGLQAEEAKRVKPGEGLCSGYTISRAILADTVALVRGDRVMCNDNTRACTASTPNMRILTTWTLQPRT